MSEGQIVGGLATLQWWDTKCRALEAEVARLQELLRGTGANRYWEERWRDTDAENQKLQAALEKIVNPNHEPPYRYSDAHEIASNALAKEGK